MENLNELLKSVAEARQAQEAAGAVMGAASDVLYATPEHEQWRAARDAFAALSAKRADLEAQAKSAILEAYAATGNKKPAPGAGIRQAKDTYALKDPRMALAWAKQYMPVAVVETVDAQQVLGYAARAPQLPEWAEIVPGKATATLAADLSEYLKGA